MSLRTKYGRINPINLSVDDTFYECFDALPLVSAERIARKAKGYWNTDKLQAEHVFYEAICGAFLAEQGFAVEYEKRWQGKTPDWTIINVDGSPMAIVEVSNHHLDKKQEDAVLEANARGDLGFAYPDNTLRLYRRFAQKAATYEAQVHADQMPYVIAVYGNFLAVVTYDELTRSLTESFGPTMPAIFSSAPHLAGAYLFSQSGVERAYRFVYVANPNAKYSMPMPSGDWLYGGRPATAAI